MIIDYTHSLPQVFEYMVLSAQQPMLAEQIQLAGNPGTAAASEQGLQTKRT
jgi:hypothetical protein